MQRWPEFRHPLFISLTLLYLAVKINQRVGHWPMPPVVSAYFADLAAMPVMLTLVLAAQRRLGSAFRGLTLPDSWLVAAWAYVSLVFEVILPRYGVAHAVADPFDVVAYAIGTCLFRRWLNQRPPPLR
ncbi:MAG: hypothetical protein EOO63_11490 [Hymenobacter sp.]|nr:MAG: hypothetical protein EOO63_11490 [Hymenobacter sp.]